MSKILVAYFSTQGTTAKVAREAAKLLNADVIQSGDRCLFCEYTG